MKIKPLWRKHKAATIIGALFVLFLAYTFYSPISSPQGSTFYGSEEALRSTSADSSFYPGGTGEGPFFDIRSGSVSIDSDDAREDQSVAKSRALEVGGRVDGEQVHENDNTITATLNLRIPADSLDSFIEWLGRYDIKSSNIGTTTVDASYIQGEIDTLTEAIETYDRLLERAEAQNDINSIQQITEAKLNALRQLRQYGFSLESLEDQERMSSVYITFTQEKDQIIPDDYDDRLEKEWRESLRRALDIVTGIGTGVVVLLARILKWIVYGAIVGVPAYYIYKYLKRRKILK